MNAVIDGDEIVYRDYTDISIAVATPKGLVVPVLRSADELSFADVEKVRLCLSAQCRTAHCHFRPVTGACKLHADKSAQARATLPLQDCLLSGSNLCLLQNVWCNPLPGCGGRACLGQGVAATSGACEAGNILSGRLDACSCARALRRRSMRWARRRATAR